MPVAAELREIAVTVCGTSIRLLVRPDTIDDRVVDEVVRTYRIEQIVERLRSKDAVTIVDIGGHIGSFSAIIATLLPRAVVHVFEPVPANFAVLERNIRHAGVHGRVHARHAAVSARQGFIAADDIKLSPDSRNTGGHSVIGAAVSDAPDDRRPAVELVTLGPLLNRLGHVDLVKIDCEGAEFEILYSVTPAQLAAIDAMVGEVHGCHGFAGMKTCGLEWSIPALLEFLARRYPTVQTDHRKEYDSAVLETFYAFGL